MRGRRILRDLARAGGVVRRLPISGSAAASAWSAGLPGAAGAGPLRSGPPSTLRPRALRRGIPGHRCSWSPRSRECLGCTARGQGARSGAARCGTPRGTARPSRARRSQPGTAGRPGDRRDGRWRPTRATVHDQDRPGSNAVTTNGSRTRAAVVTVPRAPSPKSPCSSEAERTEGPHSGHSSRSTKTAHTASAGTATSRVAHTRLTATAAGVLSRHHDRTVKRAPARDRRRGRRPTRCPTERRIRLSGTSSGEPATEAWVIRPGCSIRLSTAPSDSASVNSFVAAATRSAASGRCGHRRRAT